MINKIGFEKALKILNQSNNIILTSHMNPDGDAIGSILGLYYFLKECGKQVSCLLNDPVPYNFEYLEGSAEIERYAPDRHDKMINNVELIVVLDVNDYKRLRNVGEAVNNSKASKLVIDHHIDPKEFADNYVTETEATSTGELVYEIISLANTNVSRQSAMALYAAIMTDTGSFRFPRTDSRTHEIIAELIKSGADPVVSYEEIYNRVPFRVMALLGTAYSSLEQHCDGKVCIMILSADDFKKHEAGFSDVENFVETLMTIDGVKLGALLSENPGDEKVVRVSYRSKDEYNVREIAMNFGGGGHHHAAGSRIYDTELEEVRKKVLAKIEELF